MGCGCSDSGMPCKCSKHGVLSPITTDSFPGKQRSKRRNVTNAGGSPLLLPIGAPPGGGYVIGHVVWLGPQPQLVEPFILDVGGRQHLAGGIFRIDGGQQFGGGIFNLANVASPIDLRADVAPPISGVGQQQKDCCCFEIRNPRFRFIEEPKFNVTGVKRCEDNRSKLCMEFSIDHLGWRAEVEARGQCGQIGWVQEICEDACLELRFAACNGIQYKPEATTAVKQPFKECVIDYQRKDHPGKCPWYKELQDIKPDWDVYGLDDRPDDKDGRVTKAGYLVHSVEAHVNGKVHLICFDGDMHWMGYFEWEYYFVIQYNQ